MIQWEDNSRLVIKSKVFSKSVWWGGGLDERVVRDVG